MGDFVLFLFLSEEEESAEREKQPKTKSPRLLTFPPGKNSIELAARVSPGLGRRETLSTTSWVIEPTTRRGRGRVEDGEEEVGRASIA